MVLVSNHSRILATRAGLAALRVARGACRICTAVKVIVGGVIDAFGGPNDAAGVDAARQYGAFDCVGKTPFVFDDVAFGVEHERAAVFGFVGRDEPSRAGDAKLFRGAREKIFRSCRFAFWRVPDTDKGDAMLSGPEIEVIECGPGFGRASAVDVTRDRIEDDQAHYSGLAYQLKSVEIQQTLDKEDLAKLKRAFR